MSIEKVKKSPEPQCSAGNKEYNRRVQLTAELFSSEKVKDRMLRAAFCTLFRYLTTNTGPHTLNEIATNFSILAEEGIDGRQEKIAYYLEKLGSFLSENRATFKLNSANEDGTQQWELKQRYTESSHFQEDTKEPNVLYGKDFIDTSAFETRESLLEFLDLASKIDQLLQSDQNNEDLAKLLEHRYAMLAFFEASTRTNTSLAFALQRLGFQIINQSTMDFSSLVKGETFEDTISALKANKLNILVLRHSDDSSSQRARDILREDDSRTLLLNAGSGSAEHPTQSLLDLATIRKKFGTLDELTITLVGDLKNGRTGKSLMKILAQHGKNITFNLRAPKGLEMPQEFIDSLKYYNIKIIYGNTLDNIEDTDVLYVTRVQKERMSAEEAARFKDNSFNVTPEIVKVLKQNAIIMHPLPRVNELSPAIDDDERAVYREEQMEQGLPTRMALILSMMRANPHALINKIIEKKEKKKRITNWNQSVD